MFSAAKHLGIKRGQNSCPTLKRSSKIANSKIDFTMNRVAKFFSSEKFGRGAEGKVSNFGKNFAMSKVANVFSVENFD